MTKNEYPSDYKPGEHWASDAGWEFIDRIQPPEVIPATVRSYLAGLIAGILVAQYQALKPFADEAELHDAESAADDEKVCGFITVGDLRRARDLVNRYLPSPQPD